MSDFNWRGEPRDELLQRTAWPLFIDVDARTTDEALFDTATPLLERYLRKIGVIAEKQHLANTTGALLGQRGHPRKRGAARVSCSCSRVKKLTRGGQTWHSFEFDVALFDNDATPILVYQWSYEPMSTNHVHWLLTPETAEKLFALEGRKVSIPKLAASVSTPAAGKTKNASAPKKSAKTTKQSATKKSSKKRR